MAQFNHTILQVIPSLDAGGAERTTLEIATAVVRAGGRALVASHGGRLAAEIESAGGEVILMPVHSKNPVTMWINGRRLAALIKNENIDIIHARSRAPAWSALAASKQTGIPFVTTYHGAYKAGGPIKRLYNSSMLRGDIVIANSRYTGEAILRLGGVGPERLKVIPRGADLDYFDPSIVTEMRLQQLGEKWENLRENNKLRVVFPGRLTSWKGHAVAIEAAAIYKSYMEAGKAPGLTLVFCGAARDPNHYERELRAMIDQSGVGNMVHLVGDCEDMPAAYAWSDLVISPSIRPEAFGRVAVEAGSMGKPVIASAHGGAMETIIDGESGIHVPPGDAKALAEAILRIAHMSTDERAIMGKNGRARTMRIYSAAAMSDATLGVYSELLGLKSEMNYVGA